MAAEEPPRPPDAPPDPVKGPAAQLPAPAAHPALPPASPPPPVCTPPERRPLRERVEAWWRSLRTERAGAEDTSLEERVLDLVAGLLVRSRRMTGRVHQLLPRLVTLLAEPISILQLYTRKRCNYLASAIASQVAICLIPYLLLAGAIMGHMIKTSAQRSIDDLRPGDLLAQAITAEQVSFPAGHRISVQDIGRLRDARVMGVETSTEVVAVQFLRPGDVVAADARDLKGSVVVPAGTIVGRAELDALTERQVPQVIRRVDAEIRKHVSKFIQLNYPAVAESFSTMLDALIDQKNTLSVIGFLLLLWTSRSLVFSVTFALNTIQGAVEDKTLWRALLDTIIVVCLAVFLITASIVFSIVRAWVSSKTSLLTENFQFEEGLALHAVSLPLSIAVTGVIFLAFYIILPRQRPSWMHALIGALTGAVLLELSKYLLIGYFAIESTKFKQVYGALAAMIYVTLWSYLFAQGVVLGGCTAYHLETERTRRKYVAE